MMDFLEARTKMVDNQVRTSDVTEHRLLSAMMSVPREAFVPDDRQEFAYLDEDVSLEGIAPEAGAGRFLMEPAQFARLAQLADVNEGEVILVIGSGSGYSSAVLSMLGLSVVGVESDPVIAAASEARLEATGFNNVAIVNGPLDQGCAAEAPFDVIFIDGAVGEVPTGLLDQLSEGGRMVAVVGTGNSARARLYVRDNGIIGERDMMNCAVQPLPGFEQPAGFSF